MKKRILVNTTRTKESERLVTFAFTTEVVSEKRGRHLGQLLRSSESYIDEQIVRRCDNGYRDVQRSKSYRAEDGVRRGNIYANDTLSCEEANRFIRNVMSTEWFNKRFFQCLHFGSGGWHPINVTYLKKDRRACTGGSDGITIAPWGRNRLVILHELAHCLNRRLLRQAGQAYGHRKPYAAHGRAWAFIFLELVGLGIGSEPGGRLKEEFKKHKVRFNRRRSDAKCLK